MNILYLAMVLNKLSSTLYSANEVGYILAVSNTHNGVEFKLEGFNDVNVMKMFLRTVLDGEPQHTSLHCLLSILILLHTLICFHAVIVVFNYG